MARTTVFCECHERRSPELAGGKLSRQRPAASKFAGELRGYNVFASKAGGNCVDLTVTANPYRFYGLRASGCTIGLNLAGTQSEEFHG